MDLLKREDLRSRMIGIVPELKLRPNTGRLWHDVLFLLIAAVLQIFILPSIFGKHLTIDILTPWLAISFVRQHSLQATILALVGALVLEMHDAVPAGMYIVIYWIMANVIINMRLTISWRHAIPWLVMYTLCSIWVVFFEAFVTILKVGVDVLDLQYWWYQLIRIAISVGIGMFFCREWLDFNAEEPVPQ